LNLLSNALKFTLEGAVHLTLDVDDRMVVLRVRDTGSGIPADELPRLFQRFHRVHGARARTHEGSGIGLPLVSAIVRLHTGQVSAGSRPADGTELEARLPLGREHLPPDHVGEEGGASHPRAAQAYVEEAMRWLPGSASPPEAHPAGSGTRQGRIVVADDNADMR